MHWITQPAEIVGLLTLIILEIVLSIDNLIFISILVNKLPQEQREKARSIGLTLAVLMRIGLLASIAWIASLTKPLLEILGKSISARDLILILGGLFLIVKATIELHERIEGSKDNSKEVTKSKESFWGVISQIIVIDAVFSIDSVITAVGMSNHLQIMVIAVIVAMIVMVVASRWISEFLNKHSTLIILCLGFLLMIGFALMLDGFGFHIPKGYLYTAIAFSLMVEALNNMASKKTKK